MHTTRNRILFFGSASAVGFAALGLHKYMMLNCFDAKGLLIAGNLPGKLLWVLAVGYAVCLGALLTTIGGEGSYEDNFPRCTLSGSLMLAAGAALVAAVPELELELQKSEAYLPAGALAVRQALGWIVGLLPYGAAAAMAALGVFRMTGKRPPVLLSGVVCLFYMMVLVNNYRNWSGDPRFYSYAFPMAAGVLLMLCSFHRTSCDGGVIQRRRLLFTGLFGAVCAIASMATGMTPWFYTSGSLWAMGSMCNVAVLPPDPEEDEEEAEAEGQSEE